MVYPRTETVKPYRLILVTCPKFRNPSQRALQDLYIQSRFVLQQNLVQGRSLGTIDVNIDRRSQSLMPYLRVFRCVQCISLCGLRVSVFPCVSLLFLWGE